MIREATEKDRNIFDKYAKHPLQSWQWGEFRKMTGVEVLRIVEEEGLKIRNVFQITWHKIPKFDLYIGYCPKSAMPSTEVLNYVENLAKKKKAIFVKFEPNEKMGVKVPEILVEGKPLFTKYTFQLDIARPEEKILSGMNQKTRYNLRLAEKKGVEIVEDKTENGFEEYWKITEETTKRQKFYNHTKKYHHLMWEAMVKESNGHLLKAVYQGKTLATWILFRLNGVLYYPYGASTSENREVMASNLIMWEAIKLGKKYKCNLFDMWGSMGPEPDNKDPWYGFHRFKQGYGGDLVEFVGSRDLVVSPWQYKVYKAVDWLRWKILRLWKT